MNLFKHIPVPWRSYFKYGLAIIILMLSIKPAVFTWHLLSSARHFRVQPGGSDAAMYRAIYMRPGAFHGFKKYNAEKAEQLLLKSMLLSGQFKRLKDAGLSSKEKAGLMTKFKNNLYLHHLFPHFIPRVRQPQNLDRLTLDLLADANANHLTTKVFQDYKNKLSAGFCGNVADFCQWQGNGIMARFFRDFHGAGSTAATALNPPAAVECKGNMLQESGFDSLRVIRAKWKFSSMAGFKPFSDGSFYMGADRAGENDNLRIMGFFVHNEKNKSRARGGAWYKQRIPVSKGWYRFRFSYATATGKEAAAFYLGKHTKEQKLSHSNGQWKQVTFLVDNRKGTLKYLKPLIRIWGTGSLWVDNVCLEKTVTTKEDQAK